MIYIDSRGKGEKEISELLLSKHYSVTVQYIESGDIVIEDIGIERKTVDDLLQSFYSKVKGHSLYEQIKVLKDTYKKSLLIVEGYINWEDRLLNSILFGIKIGWQLPIVYTSNINDTAKRIGNIFDKYGMSKTSRVPPAAIKKGYTPQQIKWQMLQCIPHIGGVVAKRILEEVPYLFIGECSSTELLYDLKEVKGLNKDSRELLIKVLCNE
jgi:ERCC4-type nuclease